MSQSTAVYVRRDARTHHSFSHRPTPRGKRSRIGRYPGKDTPPSPPSMFLGAARRELLLGKDPTINAMSRGLGLHLRSSTDDL